jgi:hypothetical protein
MLHPTPAAIFHLMLRSIGTLALCSTMMPQARAQSVAEQCQHTLAAGLVTLHLVEPLLADAHGASALTIGVREDGCVLVEFPIWDSRAGAQSFRLEQGELTEFRAALEDSGVSSIDPRRLLSEIGSQPADDPSVSPGGTPYRSDAAILQFEFGPAVTRASSTHWPGLSAGLLVAPSNRELSGIAAVRDRLIALSSDRRLRRPAQR